MCCASNTGMTTDLTPAQQKQQHNRNRAGRYQTKPRTEAHPGVVDPVPAQVVTG
jgi:hypothetical protein